jgi:hypothetical protein
MKQMKPIALVLILTGLCSLYGQGLLWEDNGDFNYADHVNRIPGKPQLPETTPPGFDAGIAHPVDLEVSVSGMDFLSDGRMVLAQWDGFNSNDRIHILENPAGDPESIDNTVIAEGIWDIMALNVVDDEIYYTAQDGIWKLNRTDGGYEKELFVRQPVPVERIDGSGGFPMTFNLEYHDGWFYYGICAYKNFNIPDNDGIAVRISKETGEQQIFARGLRMPNGMALNKDGDLFYADNQGGWRPSNPVYHLEQGVHCGYPKLSQVEGNTGGGMLHFTPRPPESEIRHPAVHIPYAPGGRSLTNMVYLEEGPFADQFLIGDNAWGVVHRISLEKVNGMYQGASFHFSGVLESGIQSFTVGPDGTIFGGALGHPANGWNWQNKITGLMKWKVNGEPLCDITTIRSTRSGFDIQFTEPLDENAANPNFYWVESWQYVPTPDYGGPRLDVTRMNITEIRTSEDRKTLALTVDGLAAGRVYRFAFSPDLKFENGNSLWYPHAWYTLNVISEREPLTSIQPISHMKNWNDVRIKHLNNRHVFSITEAGPYHMELISVMGGTITQKSGLGPDDISFNTVKPGLYVVRGVINGKTGIYKLPWFKGISD